MREREKERTGRSSCVAQGLRRSDSLTSQGPRLLGLSVAALITVGTKGKEPGRTSWPQVLNEILREVVVGTSV